ncbi:MAG: hypothetical protein RIQ53_4552 [Pseudomonadota bacterium]|jgi:uncharacterized membrane protein
MPDRKFPPPADASQDRAPAAPDNPPVPLSDPVLLLADLSLASAAVALALWLRPWRSFAGHELPWPWLLWWLLLPLLWGADHYAHSALLQPLSGAVLLMLLAGWPLAMMALPLDALLVWGVGDLPAALALHRLVWLGVVPATLALLIGAGLRRWLPHHLFIYILGRGFFGTLLAVAVAGALALVLTGPPAGAEVADLLVARWLAASGEAFLTGMLVAIFVAFRPQWLATYSDRLYLPR